MMTNVKKRTYVCEGCGERMTGVYGPAKKKCFACKRAAKKARQDSQRKKHART